MFNTEIAIQASKPLTIAYNTALSLLEEYYIPDFCHDVYSNDLNLTCGNSAGDIVGPRDAYNRSERSSLKTGSISRSSSLMFSTGSRKPSIKMPVKSKETENLPMIGRDQNRSKFHILHCKNFCHPIRRRYQYGIFLWRFESISNYYSENSQRFKRRMCLCYLSWKIRREFKFQAPRTNSMLCRILCPRKQTERY